MKHISAHLILFLALSACTENSPEITDLRTGEEKQESLNPSENNEPLAPPPAPDDMQKNNAVSVYSYRLISGDHGWGYQIYKDSSMMINQPHIPSISGVRGFETRAKAEIAARHILKEIELGHFPPTVDEATLRRIGAL